MRGGGRIPRRIVARAVCSAILLLAAGCGPWALYLRSPAPGIYFSNPQTLPSMPAAKQVPIEDKPKGKVEYKLLADGAASVWLEVVPPAEGEGVANDRYVMRRGEAHVELNLSDRGGCGPEYPCWTGARIAGGVTIVDVITMDPIDPYGYYSDVAYHRIWFPEGCVSPGYDKHVFGRGFCHPTVQAYHGEDGRFRVFIHQEAILGCPLLPTPFTPLPLGTIEKTILLVEKEPPGRP
jgi:hypothetical protein